MQDWWRGWWTAQATDEPQPLEDPGDFGFNDPEGIKRWGIHYFLSGYDPGHLPRPGGVMALTNAEYEDLSLLMYGASWQRYEKWLANRAEQGELG